MLTRLFLGLVLGFMALSLLVSAGPVLMALLRSALPLVIALGAIIALLRLVWHFTRRY